MNIPYAQPATNKSPLVYFFKREPLFLKKEQPKSLVPLLLALISFWPAAGQADTVSAAVGRPLQRAEVLIQAHKYRAALTELQQASTVGRLTETERTAIAQLHGTAEAGAGNYAQAATDYQTVLATGAVPAAERVEFTQAIAGFYFQGGDYPQTVSWVKRYIAAGGKDTQTRALLPQADLELGDYAGAEQAVQRDEHNGATLPETELQLLAYSAQKSGDQAGYFLALIALLQAYPSASTWNTAIATVTARPDFPDASTLDAYRLRRATGTLSTPGDYEDYAERAVLAGQSREASAVIDEGFSKGILNAQMDNGHAGRLKTLADSSAAQAAADGLADPLQQGVAEYQAGRNTLAVAAFNQSAAGNDAQAALARLWAICAQNAARTP
jgi:hypothetical protein